MLLPDLTLAQRLERFRMETQVSYAHAFGELYPHLESATEPIGSGAAVFAGPDSPLNRAVSLGMEGPVSADEIDRAEAFYFSRKAPCAIDVCPLAHRSLWELLGKRDYRIAFFLNTLIRPAVGVPDPAVPAAPDVTVAPVPPEGFDAWAAAVSEGFGSPPVPNQPVIARVTAANRGVTAFAATIDGELAGGGAMQLRDGVGGLMSTSVLPAFRGRGVQTALLRARLTALAEAGCDVVNVQTSPGSGSQRNVMRFGFVIAYTKAMMVRDLPR